MTGAPRARSVRPPWTAIGLALLAAATLSLWTVSFGKWSDALIDTGSEWGYPEALARGELLYRDVVYWFGPWTPYFHALFFRALGSSFSTLAVAGVAGSLGVLAAFHFALRRVTHRSAAWLWTALAIPALVFMPNSGGAILGMGYRIWHPAGFALVSVALVTRVDSRRNRRVSLAAAGAAAALAGLSRTEWGVATLAALLLALWVHRSWGRQLLQEAAVCVGAALIVAGGVLGLFAAAAGRGALFDELPVLLMNIPEETRARTLAGGVRGWRGGLLPMAYSALLWSGLFVLSQALAFRGRDPARAKSRVGWLLGILAILALIGALAGSRVGYVFFGAAPLVSLGALVAGLLRRGRPRAAALAAFGCLGVVLSHRRLFHIGDSGYVAPPLLFAFASAAGLLQLALLAEARSRLRSRMRQIHLGGLTVFVAVAFGIRTQQYLSDDRIPVPGTSGLLSASPAMVRELTGISAAVREATPHREGCVVVPEGMIVNYLSGRRNPIRHKLFIPGYVTDENEPVIIRDLEAARPLAVAFVPRPVGEYDRGAFGRDYGRGISAWVEANCSPRPSGSRHSRLFFCGRSDE